MYGSSYSQVSMHSLRPQKKMQYRSKGKSCGYYMRIVFFFSSLIQSLIIVSLVLFLIYGKKQDSAPKSRIQDLEKRFSNLSLENVNLQQQRKNLTALLNSTLIEKARNDWDLAVLRALSNRSVAFINDFKNQLDYCNREMFFCKSRALLSASCQQTVPGNCNCGLWQEQMKARLALVESNFTQTIQRMNRGSEQMAKERDNLNLQAISLRRDKFTLEMEAEFCRRKCKDDFAQSLSGINNVTKAFLLKIESLSHMQLPFHLTCSKQMEHLEQIRTNCTSLSREVESKLQRYLDSVGEQVSGTQAENSRLKAENMRMTADYRWCSQNRSGLIQQHKQNTDKLQRKHDEDKEKLLMDKMRLNGEIEVLHKNVNYKSKEAEHLREQLKQLNMTCGTKSGLGVYPGSSPSRMGTGQSGWGMSAGGGSSSASSSSSGGGQAGRTGSGSSYSSSGSTYNKAGSTGTGSSSTSLSSGGSSSSTGYGFNKPGSTGTGSSSTSLSSGGSSSSTGYGFNKPGSTGTGSSSTSLSSGGSSSSTGYGFNKPGSTGTGSSSTSLSSGGSSSSTGYGFNKPGSTGTGSSSTSLSSGGSSSSTGYGFNKPGSTGTGSSSTSLSSSASGSSTGLGHNRPGSTGGAFPSFGSTGSNSNLGSSGTGSSKPATSGKGSASYGSSSGSTGSSPNLSSSGTGSSKPTSNVKSSSSTGSTGSTSKSGSSSSGLSWFSFGKTGSGTGKGTSSGSSSGGTGSTLGGGRTSALGGGSVSVSQHLQDLQRLINPARPEEKQDLSRILG